MFRELAQRPQVRRFSGGFNHFFKRPLDLRRSARIFSF
jgi:hypothetical protein